MIRRGFWLTAGAVTGIYGYRRVSAAGRRLSGSLSPAAAETTGLTAAKAAGLGRRGVISLARETYRFSRDVREGMQLYLARPPAEGSTNLSTTNLEPKDGQ